MALVRWDPFGELLGMQREMDRLFSRLGTPARSGGGEETRVAWMPRVDVRHKDGDLIIEAEIPGMKTEDIDVEVCDGVLTLKGERKTESEEEAEGYVVRERSWGSFERSMTVPEGVDPATIAADYADGVLTLTVPEAAEPKAPKTTKIEVGSGE